MLETMRSFFASRVDSYDEHMLNAVAGCREGYVQMARLLPQGVVELLDLGCGTGLELDEIFKIKPSIHVTGIDLTQAMLDKLRQKHPEKALTLINASYFEQDFGSGKYDAAISFQTLHHFLPADKVRLYSKICMALKDGGQYIECDYMVTSQAEEDFFYSESSRIRREQNIPDGAFYHFDTPCTVDNQKLLLAQAGFESVRMHWKMGNTTLLVAKKTG